MILAGDVGGTKTNLALCDDAGAPVREATLAAEDFDSLEAMVDQFLTPDDRVDAACFGVAGPVTLGAAKITNLPWTIRERMLEARLSAPVALLNDVQATALGILVIPPSSFAVLQAGNAPPANATIAVIALGTGLGEALLYHDGRRYRALPSEGGHADFAACTDEEVELLRYLRGLDNQHVSVERVLSGNGIGNLYAFAAQAAAGSEKPAEPGWLAGTDDRNAAISDAGLTGSDPHAVRALKLFAQLLGAEAGNVALRGLASGGVVIGGGIPPKILPVLRSGSLVDRFRAKGRFSTWMHARPVRVALDPKTALLGAAHHAATIKENR